MILGNTTVKFYHLGFPNNQTDIREFFDILQDHRVKDMFDVEHITICRLYNNGEVFSEGFAFQKGPDNFSRATGRRIALTKALRDIDSKALRTDIWQDYFRVCK